jgi:hypothetical protein
LRKQKVMGVSILLVTLLILYAGTRYGLHFPLKLVREHCCQRRPGSTSSLGLASHQVDKRLVRVALTREAGANDKLLSALPNLECYEIPCIAFEVNKDHTAVAASAANRNDIVVITSPQSAMTFLPAWESVGRPKIKVASVGQGTSKPLIDAGLPPEFEASEATAQSLGNELPRTLGRTVLYPASMLADNSLEQLLTSRGFQVNSKGLCLNKWTGADYD